MENPRGSHRDGPSSPSGSSSSSSRRRRRSSLHCPLRFGAGGSGLFQDRMCLQPVDDRKARVQGRPRVPREPEQPRLDIPGLRIVAPPELQEPRPQVLPEGPKRWVWRLRGREGGTDAQTGISDAWRKGGGNVR